MRKQPKKRSKRTTKRNNMFTKLTPTVRTRKHLYILIVIVLFGLVGSYLVFHGRAYYNPGDPGTVYFDNPANMMSHPAGTPFTMTLYAHVPNPTPAQNPAGTLHVNIDFDAYANAGYSSVACGTAGTCNPGTGTAASAPWQDKFERCININASNFGTTMAPLLTINFVSVQDGAYNLGMNVNWTTGTCASPSGYYSNSYASGWLMGQCGPSGTAAPCGPGGGDSGPPGNPGDPPGGSDPGDDPGDSQGPDNQGEDPGTGQSPNTSGSNSGGSGSTAKKQSTKSNTIPSSTAQGNNQQPELQPSPFYDGKEYAAGSDPDTLGATAFSVGGRKIAYLWLYVLVAVITAGASGYYFWRKRWVFKPR